MLLASNTILISVFRTSKFIYRSYSNSCNAKYLWCPIIVLLSVVVLGTNDALFSIRSNLNDLLENNLINSSKERGEKKKKKRRKICFRIHYISLSPSDQSVLA